MDDRHGGQNSTMQPRNGVCNKIENYISELGQWYARFRSYQRLKRSKGAMMSSHPQAGVPCINGEGARRDTVEERKWRVFHDLYTVGFSSYSSNIRFFFKSSFLFLIYLTNGLIYLAFDRYLTQIRFYRFISRRLLTVSQVNRSFSFLRSN